MVLPFVDFSDDSPPDIAAEARAGADVADEVALQLARRFRPILQFDRNEPWRPLNIEAFLGQGGHRVCTSGVAEPEGCDNVSSSADFLKAGSETTDRGKSRYLDIAGKTKNGDDFRSPRLSGCPDLAPKDCNSGDDSAIYYKVRAANERFYVDYWWFFRYNDFSRLGAITNCSGVLVIECGDHEGDWEGVTVVTEDHHPYAAQYVGLASHAGVFRSPRNQMQMAGERPVVYIARGSHGAYPQPCTGSGCRQQFRIGSVRRPEERYGGEKAWGRNAGPDCEQGVSCLQPFPKSDADPGTSWNDFQGLWGLVCARVGPACPVGKGPKSPSVQPRYREPYCFRLNDRKSCDAPTHLAKGEALPGRATEIDCQAWLGAAVSVLACDRQRIAAALGPDSTQLKGTLTLALPGALADDRQTPGVAQLTGPPLAVASRVEISGVASKDAGVTARATTSNAVFDTRFTHLGLRNGGTAFLEVLPSREGLRFRLTRPNGTFARQGLSRKCPLTERSDALAACVLANR